MSVRFDDLARRALTRCYQNPGRWLPVILPPLTARVFIYWYTRNVDLRQRDPWDEAMNRYCRSFVRACYFNHKWFGDFDGLRVQRRTAAWEGLVLVSQGEATLQGGRMRLMAAEKGDRRLPKRKYQPESPGVRSGIRVGGVGVGEAL